MLRFSIRELLLLTLVIALSIGWWIDRRRLLVEVKSLREELSVTPMIEVGPGQYVGEFPESGVKPLRRRFAD